ncbi:endolytic transglycosylase MltG [Candidatus Mycobacterium wuenschmannii]|uniref:Endolytic murein transglycosylase n=1 Tax=Candidatus Mycobacterium wuenschmannii TaxID=3027808 RepID=A0ABY8W512_9MYCO|nr:endolytic transglycosylase MltG [Candidatus Mycobacterium wuenschmannii]WIM90147.1 endolytic transglycosylase MltG [Candidatus Mycobacterium wuenschmannii]
MGSSRRGRSRADRIRAERDRRRRNTTRGILVSLTIGVIIAAAFVGSKLWRGGSANDFAGDGKQDLVVEVHAGDSTTVIGETLHTQHVVKTVKAFLEAAQGNQAITAIQPGYYRLRSELPAATALQRLVAPGSRVGKLVIPEGQQLDDTADVKTNETTPGIFTMIEKATCVELDGNKHCVSSADLRAAAEKTSIPSLLVPPWAVPSVTAMGNDHRRVEGLIAPGTWNVNPSASPEEILSTLINSSAELYMKSGLQDTATAMNTSPYNILVVASLVQRESKPQDFAKVARVIYNRLTEHRKLEFDSTVNYPLDRREVATTDGDRAQPTPWNTYASEAMPATPICSPGVDALKAAEHPEEGDWLYFVTIDTQGTTLFTRDYQQHLANIELAKRNGVLDSAR